MLGLLYQKKQIYSFVNRTEIVEILKHDQIGKVNIDESESLNTIEYEINNQLCIRLNDLLYQIVNIVFIQECNFVVIHLGQLLILISKLIKKVIDLEENNLKHDYLDFNRIWLKFRVGQPCFSTIYVQTDYDIHFTGYQCPIYEQNSPKVINMNKSMQQIIIQIIEEYKDYIRLKDDSSPFKNKVYNQIYLPIIESCQKQSLLETLTLIGFKLSTCDYHNQTLLQFDQKDTGYKRSQRFKDVQFEMDTIMHQKLNKDPLYLQWTYYFAVPFLANKIKEKLLYSNAAFDYTQVQQEYEKTKDIVKKALQKWCVANNLVNNVIIDKFQNIEKKFKVNDLQVEQQKILKEIQEKLLNHKIFNYFNNSLWMYLNNRQDYSKHITGFATKLIVPIVEDRLEQFTTIKLLELLDDLI